MNVDRQVELDDVVKDNPGLKIGGFYSPPHCQPRDKAKQYISTKISSLATNCNVCYRLLL